MFQGENLPVFLKAILFKKQWSRLVLKQFYVLARAQTLQDSIPNDRTT